MEHNISSLPKWAQFKITDLERDITILERQMEEQSKAHAVLMNREWFTLHGPMEENEYYKLFLLFKNAAHPVCSIYEKDLLLIGRFKEKENVPKEKGDSNGASSKNDGNPNGRLAETSH